MQQQDAKIPDLKLQPMPVEVTKQHTFTGHRDSVYALAKGADPTQFFSASGDGMIVQWNLNQPDEGRLVAQLNHSIYALYHHPTSGLLVAGENFEGLHMLDRPNKKEWARLPLNKSYIFDIQSSGNRLFVATGDGTIFEVDMDSLTVRNKINVSYKAVRTLAVNEKTRELAAGYSDNHIRIFDLENLELKHDIHAHANSVFTIKYMPGRNYLLSGSRDARLKAWDIQTGYALAGEVVAHLYAINHLDFSPDLKHFVTCSLDKSIKVWDATTLTLLKVIDKGRYAGHATSVNRVLWLAHQAQVVSASDDKTISVWKLTINQAQ